jgi:hypothetical protein
MSLPSFSSQLIADVGISLGDEGKGRLIPEIAEELAHSPHRVSVVLKVNGGANSGHTAAGIKLNLLPSGVVEREIPHLAIGSGPLSRNYLIKIFYVADARLRSAPPAAPLSPAAKRHWCLVAFRFRRQHHEQ